MKIQKQGEKHEKREKKDRCFKKDSFFAYAGYLASIFKQQ